MWSTIFKGNQLLELFWWKNNKLPAPNNKFVNYNYLKLLTLKSYQNFTDGQYLTGITDPVNLVSGNRGNHLKNISILPQYSTLLGFTEEEIKKCFPAYISKLAKRFDNSEEEVMNLLRGHYNGYRFSFKLAKLSTTRGPL